MGKYSIYMCGIAAIIMYLLNHTHLMIVAIFVTLGSFWSLGIMYNHAVLAARKNKHYNHGFNNFTVEEIDQVPNWITSLNIGFNVLGLILFITALTMIFI